MKNIIKFLPVLIAMIVLGGVFTSCDTMFGTDGTATYVNTEDSVTTTITLNKDGTATYDVTMPGAEPTSMTFTYKLDETTSVITFYDSDGSEQTSLTLSEDKKTLTSSVGGIDTVFTKQ